MPDRVDAGFAVAPSWRARLLPIGLLGVWAGAGCETAVDSPGPVDAAVSVADGGTVVDASSSDSGASPDAGWADASDGGWADASDGGRSTDTGIDGGADAGFDGGYAVDAGFDGDSGATDGGVPDGGCGALVCPTGFGCGVEEVCTDGTSALVFYDMAALRADPSLDVHVTFEPTGGATTALSISAYRPEHAAVLVPYVGAGRYVPRIRDDDPWWTTEPLVLSRSRTAAEVISGGAATSVLAQSYQDMGWGLWQNAIGNQSAGNRSRKQAFIDAGLPIFGYLEGTGNLFVFLASIHDPVQKYAGTDVSRTVYTHWSWGAWGGTFPPDQRAIWMGAHTYYDAPAYAAPYHAGHPTYGDAVAPTDPSGQPLVSPPGAATDPRLHALYRRCATTDINGEPALDLSLQGSRDVAGLEGALQIGGTSYSILGFARDVACPTWSRYHEVSLRYAVDNGTIGSWMDNVSMWDAWKREPVANAFGEHSHAGFEAYLLAHADAAYLTRADLQQHVGRMSMRCIVKWKARTGFGDDVGAAGRCSDPIAFNHAGLIDDRWDADLSWRAWVAYSAQLHTDYHRQLKATLDALDPDFLWGTNDLPTYAGPVAEHVPPSMNLSEMSVGPHVLKGPVRLPPEGSPAAAYDIGGAFDRSQFQTVWMYIDEPAFADSASLHRALAAEALAYDSFLMPSAQDARAPGTTASAGSIHSDLVPHARELEGRRPLARIGVVFSPDSWLVAHKPAGVPQHVLQYEGRNVRVDDLPHLHEAFGWHAGLQATHHTVAPLIAGRLDALDLEALELIVLPNVEVLPAALRDQVLGPWVNAGGTLVITGRTGRYRGRGAFFEPWSSSGAATGSAPLTGVPDLDQLTATTTVAFGAGAVISVPGLPGAATWLGRAAGALPGVIAQRGALSVLPDDVVSVTPDSTVMVRLHHDLARGRGFIDVVNRAWDRATDSLPPVGPVEVVVRRPQWMRGARISSHTAAGRGHATVVEDGDLLRVTVDSVADIVTVVVQLQP